MPPLTRQFPRTQNPEKMSGFFGVRLSPSKYAIEVAIHHHKPELAVLTIDNARKLVANLLDLLEEADDAHG